MDELKPCPFCGGEAKIGLVVNRIWMSRKYDGRYVGVGCTKCGASTPMFAAHNHTGSPLMNKANEGSAMELARKVWNRRVNDG